MEGKARIVFPIVMAFMMSLIVSGIVTVINLGLSWEIPGEWFKAWLAAFPTAAIVALVIVTPARRLTGWIVAKIEGR